MGVNGRKFARDLMGRRVRVTKCFTYTDIVEFFGRKPSDTTRDLKHPWTGWVVGYTYRRQGKTVSSYEEGTQFIHTGPGTPVILVCPWPGRKTADVPFGGVEVITEDEGTLCDPLWTPEWKEITKLWPRDEKGRFTSEELPPKGVD